MIENQKYPQKLFYILTGIETLIAIFYLVSLPTDPKNVIFFGLSSNRLILLMMMVFIFVFSIFSYVHVNKKPEDPKWIERIRSFFKKFYYIYPVILFLCWIIILFPAYRFGKYEVIYSRIQPLLILLSVIIFQFLILLNLKITKNKNDFLSIINWKVFGFFSLIVVIVWVFLVTTRIGLDIDHDFWGGAATPILPMMLYINICFVFSPIY